MPTLRSLFAKPVDRVIEGVIKADDMASLYTEVDEYVLTNEIERSLETFFEAYNNYEGANGVWISGFFGSGKSHLLKMLALLLENQLIDGTPILDMFLPKCGDNAILRASLERAVSIPSQSILFNIDQKADVISKSQVDALLSVFVKVFNETLGYYGNQGHIAQFERDLDSRGQYASFKETFQQISGKPWKRGREQAILERSNIAKAYAQVSGEPESAVLGIIEKYREAYTLSIEDFAAMVTAYIESKGPNFRLNFFVDEVGQYIADNVKLMTNLQTIAESLATKSRGRAWIVVTAQEEMESVVGEMAKQGNDFSKIQARFANRLKLTSADVAEVIQRRLLAKTDDGNEILAGIYRQYSNDFRTLFEFADGSPKYQNFRDQEHFQSSYPFIPYQFGLFQLAIQNLSVHNAFEGKHSSVGERSMLGVFQQVVSEIADQEVRKLATFDQMYSGLQSALKSTVQRTIIHAENELDDVFAIRLLKALFLVKYIREFKPTIHNLVVLMTEDLDGSRTGLQEKVEEALRKLEQQTYIERNGDLFEFLTNEEKDIEQEIKETNIEESERDDTLRELIFERVLGRLRRIPHEESGYSYSYAQFLDGKLISRDYDLSINISTPLSDHGRNLSAMRLESYRQNELLVVIPADDRFTSDLLMHEKTKKYIRQNTSSSQRETTQRIIREKADRNNMRFEGLVSRLEELLGSAKFFIAGEEITVNSEVAVTRIELAFNQLVTKTYRNLRMLSGGNYSEADITRFLNDKSVQVFGDDTDALTEPEQHMLATLNQNRKLGMRTTVKELIDAFGKRPNGWPENATLCVLARLYARGRVEIHQSGALLDTPAIERALKNSHTRGGIIIDLQQEFTRSQVRRLHEFYTDFFDEPPASNEAKALALEVQEAVGQELVAFKDLKASTLRYPFSSKLDEVIEAVNSLAGKDYAWFLLEFENQETLLQHKEEVVSPIRRFLSGAQKGIIDDALKVLESNEINFSSIDIREVEDLKCLLLDADLLTGGKIQEIAKLVNIVREALHDAITNERCAAINSIELLETRLQNESFYSELSSDLRESAAMQFRETIEALKAETVLPVIRDRSRRFEEISYPEIIASLQPNIQPQSTPSEPVKPSIVYRHSLQISFPGKLLYTETDVEQYVKALSDALKEEIKKGNQVKL